MSESPGRPTMLLFLSVISVQPLGTASAQKKADRVRVLAGSAMRTAPGGQVIGVLSRAFEGSVEMVQGPAVRLRINGFVSQKTLRLETNSTRGTVGGTGDGGGILRTGPGEKEPALAILQRGAVVFLGGKSTTFLAVNRTVWVDRSRLATFASPGAASSVQGSEPPVAAPGKPAALEPAVSASAKQTPVAPASSSISPVTQPRPASPALPAMQTVGASALRLSPDGDIITALPSGTVVSPISAENGWTRVKVDGWIATRDLTNASAKVSGELSAADVRADPAGTKGRIVRWTVEALSYQLGDGLRRELDGEPYLLARGPGKERAILYLAVPDSLVSAARALAPLSTITVTARVRSGKSVPGGVPILDLLELMRR